MLTVAFQWLSCPVLAMIISYYTLPPPSILWLVTSGASNKNCPYCQTETTKCYISQREMERKFVYTLETASNKEKHTWERFEVDNAAKTSHLCVKSSFDCCGLFLWIPVLYPSYNLECYDMGKIFWFSVHLFAFTVIWILILIKSAEHLFEKFNVFKLVSKKSKSFCGGRILIVLLHYRNNFLSCNIFYSDML